MSFSIQNEKNESNDYRSSIKSSFLEIKEQQKDEPSNIFTFEHFKMMSDQIDRMKS